MLYLSQLVLNPHSRQVQTELRNPYEMHRTLAHAFGQGERYQAARCLFRVDQLPSTGHWYLLVQSLVAPQWEYLPHADRYLLEVPAVKAVDTAVITEGRYRFRLRANPTVKRDGKRLPLRDEEAQLAWLQRKGTAHGFTLVSVRVRDATACRTRTAGDQVATLEGVTFDGVLRVVDPTAFHAALEGGIGAGKGFGFGLLSLARG